MRSALFACAAAAIAVAGCANSPNSTRGALGGAAAGAVAGAVIGNNTGSGDAGTGAAIGALAGGALGAYAGCVHDGACGGDSANANHRQYYDQRRGAYYFQDQRSGRYFYENGAPYP